MARRDADEIGVPVLREIVEDVRHFFSFVPLLYACAEDAARQGHCIVGSPVDWVTAATITTKPPREPSVHGIYLLGMSVGARGDVLELKVDSDLRRSCGSLQQYLLAVDVIGKQLKSSCKEKGFSDVRIYDSVGLYDGGKQLKLF